MRPRGQEGAPWAGTTHSTVASAPGGQGKTRHGGCQCLEGLWENGLDSLWGDLRGGGWGLPELSMPTENPPEPFPHSLLPGKPSIFQMWLLHPRVRPSLSGGGAPLGVKLCFVAASPVSSAPVLPVSEAPSAAAGALPRKSLPTLGVSTLLCPPLPSSLAGCLRGGTSLLQGPPPTRDAGPGFQGACRRRRGPTWPQQPCPRAGAQDAPGLQAAALLPAAQHGLQPGDPPAGHGAWGLSGEGQSGTGSAPPQPSSLHPRAALPAPARLTLRGHTPFGGSAQPGRTWRARSPPAPSAAAEQPSARSRRRPTAPSWRGGPGAGASAGDQGLLRTGPPGAPCARPPPPPPWQPLQQPGVRDTPACLPSGLPTPGTAAQEPCT